MTEIRLARAMDGIAHVTHKERGSVEDPRSFVTRTFKAPGLHISNNTVKPLNSRHPRSLQKCPLLGKINKIYVFTKLSFFDWLKNVLLQAYYKREKKIGNLSMLLGTA